MWYICIVGLLLSHKKEWDCVIYRDVDRPRDCHIEWNKSEKEKQILFNITFMWNLEKWYRRTYLQGRNRDTDTENKHMDTKGKRGLGWKGSLELTHTHYDITRTYCIAQGTLLSALWWTKWEGNPKTGDICIHTADSLWCTTEINTL